MTCSKCSKTIDAESSFNGICTDCFFELARSSKTRLTGDERKRLKKAVEEEMAGLLPHDALNEEVEAGYLRLLKGGDFDENVGRLVNSVERMAGLAMFREILSVIQALKTTIEEQESEIRARIKKLENLK